MSTHKLRREDQRDFILAGDAIFTIQSPNGGRFTYRVERGDDDGRPAIWFVRLLSGPDNTSDYQYLGFIGADLRYRHGRKSRVGEDAPSVIAFGWTWERLATGRSIGGVQVYHEGRCGACGRTLTTPESIERGIGPVCAERHMVAA